METREIDWPLLAGLLMLGLVLCLHISSAWLLLLNGQDVAGITSLFVPIQIFGGTTGAGIAYAVVSFGVTAMLLTGGHDQLHLLRGILHLTAAVAQQFLLMVSAAGSLLAIINGAYLDGTHIPGGRNHLSGDQLVYILLAIFHPMAVLIMYRPAIIVWLWVRVWKVNGSR